MLPCLRIHNSEQATRRFHPVHAGLSLTCGCASRVAIQGFAHHLQLPAQQWPHGIVDCAGGNQVAHLHAALLPQPVSPVLCLQDSIACVNKVVQLCIDYVNKVI